MDVRCEKCGTEYEFEKDRVGEHGVTVKCTNCGFVFKVHRESQHGSNDWLVRKADGQIVAFRQLTTLQKWIVEGRVHRSDEISRNGETWKRLGNITELEPFFSVFDKAQALNDLMTTGSVGEQPVLLNGSEILASMNPLSSQLSAAMPPPAPPATDMERPSLLPEPLATPHKPTARRSSMTPRPASRKQQPRGPSLITRQPVPAESAAWAVPNELAYDDDEHPTDEPPTPATSLEPIEDTAEDQIEDTLQSSVIQTQVGETIESTRPTEPPPPSEQPTGDLHSFAPKETGLRGPAALTGAIEEIRIDRSSSEIVRDFRREQRTKRILMSVAGLLLLGLGGGAAFALLGPQDNNPLRTVAEQYGLISPKVVKDPIEEQILHAHQDFERDTPESLDRALASLEAAARARGDSAELLADRALVLITKADALRRRAADRQKRIVEHQNATRSWKAAVKKEKSVARREKRDAKLPNAPPSINVDSLTKEVDELRTKASADIRSAFELARKAYAASPRSLAASRALAEYYRVQRDQQGLTEKHLEAAKKAAKSAGTGDASTKYIEAAKIAGDLSRASPSDLIRATQLLEEALTMRPTMVRARVFLSRVLIARSMNGLAQKELDKVLAAAPKHPEAREVLALARAPAKAPVASAAPAAAEPAAASKPAAPGPAKAKPEKMAAKAKPEKAARSKSKSAPLEASKAVVSDIAGSSSGRRSYKDWMKVADKLRKRGDARGSLSAYERAADRRVNSPQAYAGMGWAYIDLGKPVAALHVFRKAISINDQFPDGHLGRATAYRKLGQRDKAIAAYKKFLVHRPTGAEAIAAKRAVKILEDQKREASARAGTAETSE